MSVTLVNELESVQCRFTKHLSGFNLFTYDDRCARLGIDRLELRILRADLILCCNILHGFVSLSSEDFLPSFVIVQPADSSFISESFASVKQKLDELSKVVRGLRCNYTGSTGDECYHLWLTRTEQWCRMVLTVDGCSEICHWTGNPDY